MHTTALIPPLLALFLLATTGCSKSKPSSEPKEKPPVAQSPDARARPPAPPQLPPRMLKLSKGWIPNPQAIRFTVFGDSRAGYCACDSKTIKRKYCRVRYRPNSPRMVEDCPLVLKGPDLVMGAVATRIDNWRSASKGAHFSLFTGDLVYRGSCEADWKWAQKVFLNRVDKERIFPIIGNHDSWRKQGEPSPFKLFLNNAFAHLHTRGDNDNLPHYYAFRVGDSLFVNLCTGGYPANGKHADFLRADRTWLCEEASYEKQMRWMDRVLDYGVKRKVKHVFVQYHKPSFSCSRHPPLKPAHDPLNRLRPFKKKHPKVNVVAFSGHNHTTGVFLSGGVLVIVAGGGGAPQHFHSGPKACYKDKPNQPPELFWKGGKRTVRYNYFQVDVTGAKLSIREHCLARIKGKLTFQKGSAISSTGQITHTPGTCDASPGKSNIKTRNKKQ